MPLLILLSLGPVRFARAIGGHIECLDLVHVVVIHAPLGEDILAPCAKLPIATVVCARRERGVALLQASKKLADLQLDNLDQQVGVDAIKAALKMPCIQIAQNAGEEGAVVVQAVMGDDSRTKGFNAAKGEYVDMIQAGIIDPTKVVRTAVADAASVASLMTTTEAIIAEEVDDREKNKFNRPLSPYEKAGIAQGY